MFDVALFPRGIYLEIESLRLDLHLKTKRRKTTAKKTTTTIAKKKRQQQQQQQFLKICVHQRRI